MVSCDYLGCKTGKMGRRSKRQSKLYIIICNIADRWKQHIKRGVGAETPTQNKLYPAMRSVGPENFTFEIVESCERSLLDSREDFWQEYFGAKEFGYSIK